MQAYCAMSGSLEDESLMFSDDAIDELDLAGIPSCIIEYAVDNQKKLSLEVLSNAPRRPRVQIRLT